MTDFATKLNIVSIVTGLVAGGCFCWGAITMNPQSIASASATYFGGNVTLLQSLSAQRAQYMIGAIFLLISFGVQLVALLLPKDGQPLFRLSISSPIIVLVFTLILSVTIALLSINCLTKANYQAASEVLEHKLGVKIEK